MTWLEAFPDYEQRMTMMAEAVYHHLQWWDMYPECELTLVAIIGTRWEL